MEYLEANGYRRSINNFDPEARITVDELKEIYQQARLTPSSFNFQPWKVVVAHSPEIKARLREVALNQPKVTEASAILVFFGNTKQYLESDDVIQDRIKSGRMTEEDVPGMIGMARQLYDGRETGFVSRNVGLLAMNFMLSALDQGWETHPMDGFDIEGVQNLFGLGPKYLPVMMVAIGKRSPDLELHPRAMRRSFDEVFEVR